MEQAPVYRINDFEKETQETTFYSNLLGPHVKQHRFTSLPHKHDFYLVVLVTKGTGWHEIDFVKYPVKPGSVFLMQPGQMHYWKLSSNIEGHVFFHSRSFFDEGYIRSHINDFPFFSSFQSQPCTSLPKNTLAEVMHYMKELHKESSLTGLLHREKLHALTNLVYIAISRIFKERKTNTNHAYLQQLRRFEELLEKNYREQKLPGFYASQLNISEKHLNRITRSCLNKTSSQLIAERVILEAKRLLMNASLNVTETGYQLGFNDKSYFVRFFKKNTGITPKTFLSNYERK
jgi:AraC-like DNA-binding protein